MAEAIPKVKTDKKDMETMKLLADLVNLKAQILAKMGYSEDAFKLLSKIKLLYSTNSSSSGISVSSPAIEKVSFVNCSLSIASIHIEFSEFEEASSILDNCEEILENIFNTEDYEFGARITLMRLLMAREKMDLNERESLATKLGEIYQNYDHYRLIKSNTFIEFVKERILFLIDNAKFQSAIIRIKNILAILNERSNKYWHNQFIMLKA